MKIKTNRTSVLPAVLYGCETWLLTLKEKRKLRVFEENIWAKEGRGNEGVEKNYIMSSLTFRNRASYI